MWLLLIIAQFMLGYTVARRCPRSPPKFIMRCSNRWQVCSYQNLCFCHGVYKYATKYQCAPWKKWRIISKKKKCPECPKDCGCDSLKENPVCGSNGKTYKNKCTMICGKRASLACKGPCPCKDKCKAKCRRYSTFLYCARNGRTYRNSCSMRCAGAKYKCLGRCPCRGMRTWSRGRRYYRRSRGMRSYRG